MATIQDGQHLYGVVDMGSNGIRFSITNLSPPTSRIMPILYQDRAGISLYDAQFSTGVRGSIPSDIMAQVVNQLSRFQTTCADFGVSSENVHVLATEATRTAPNSEEFRELIKQKTGWVVRMLDKEEEGRIGALGVVSCSRDIKGLVMDLGGGSTQITWVVEEEGVATICPKGSFSFPYGAAALKGRLEEAKGNGKKAVRGLKEEMVRSFQDAYAQLELPRSLADAAKKGGLDLYLCGGGFRGWGYLLMKQSAVNPYPMPIINGFRASRDDFHDTASVLDEVDDSDVKIFGVSKRRVSQIPAVAFLVNVLMDALPDIKNVQFCQGGVREGFLFDRLPNDVRRQDPLQAATLPYAPPSRDAIRDLLQSALPTPSPTGAHVPKSFSGNLITALSNLLFAHSQVHKETRSAAALHSTTTGILATANSLSHIDRAILALILCERWAGDLAPTDASLQTRLRQCVSEKEAWWCQYLGRVATLIGDVYPSGRVSETRIQLATNWSIKKKDKSDMLVLQVRHDKNLLDLLQEGTERIEKVGKKKNWVQDYGVRVGIELLHKSS